MAVPLASTAVLLALLLFAVPASTGPRDHGDTPPDGFVALREADPSIGQEIRYATDRNFTGEKVDGYLAAECVLTREAADALRRVQRGLRADSYSLLVYDCYRPQRAVDHFIRWAAGPEEAQTRAEYHPRVDKDELFAEGYLAARSSHSSGSTVDLTLTREEPGSPPEEVDMGTGFDFFDPRSHTAYEGLSPAQSKARRLLRTSMEAEGFVPFEEEWWHFSYQPDPFPDEFFDFPISSSTPPS